MKATRPKPGIVTGKGRSKTSGKMSRKRIFQLSFVVVLAGLEILARVEDRRTHFRFYLFETLKAMECVTTPISAAPDSELDTEMKWPPGKILIRAQRNDPPPAEPYTLGGKVIPEACPDAKQLSLGPDQTGNRNLVFILGESAAFGFPLSYPETFTAQLELAAGASGLMPFNAAQPGWTSGLLVPLANRVVDWFKPKVLIVYAGNNEWIHFLAKDETASPRVVAVARFISNSHAIAYCEYRFFKWLVERAHTQKFESHHELIGVDYALKHPLKEPLLNWGETKKAYLRNFEANLSSMIQRAKKQNVRVILTTVPFAYKLSPAWKHPQPLALTPANQSFVEDSIQRAVAAEKKKEFSEAVNILDSALAKEPFIPVLHHLKAMALEELGKNAEAETSYAACRENMIGHLGSILSINETIRKVAASTGCELVDLKQMFDDYEHAQNRYFNDDLIIDDCHPGSQGHRLIAEALLKRLTSTNSNTTAP